MKNFKSFQEWINEAVENTIYKFDGLVGGILRLNPNKEIPLRNIQSLSVYTKNNDELQIIYAIVMKGTNETILFNGIRASGFNHMIGIINNLKPTPQNRNAVLNLQPASQRRSARLG